jgi:hypothetical protein
LQHINQVSRVLFCCRIADGLKDDVVVM